MSYLKLHLFTIISIILGAFACSKSESKDNVPTQTKDEVLSQGFEIYANNCVNCHAPRGSGNSSRIAPPIKAIKKHYQSSTTSEEQFVNEMTEFLLQPTEEKAKMPGAVKQFGLMPNIGFTKKEYHAVSTYLFNINADDKNWFEKEKKKYSLNNEGDIDYLKEGQKLAMSTKSILGKNLLGAIKEGGSEYAMEFCNERAITLTDSMSKQLNAKIKRVSDKNRNPNNSASKSELEYIKFAKKTLMEQGSASPKLIVEGNKIVGYYPIITNKMCLQCHGEPKVDIADNTLNLIKSLYPEDKAVNYGENQLRGIWVVEMKNNN